MFVERKFIKYIDNNSNILLDAPHCKAPRKEIFTDEIAKTVAEQSGFNCILSKVSRKTEADLNRSSDFPLPFQKEARKEYISVIKQLYTGSDRKRPYLHITVHGMADRDYKDIEIGTIFGKICEPEIEKWFLKSLKEKFKEKGLSPKIVANQGFWGDPSLKELKIADNYNIIQIEISKTLRENHRDALIDVFSEVLREFNLKF